MEEQKGLELSKGLDKRGGEVGGKTRVGGGAVGAGQGSGAPRGKLQGRLLPVHL